MNGNPFSPEEQPDRYEYTPYDQDPAIQGVISDRSPQGRQLAYRVSNWRDAVNEAADYPQDIVSQEKLARATEELQVRLTMLGIKRTIREKPAADE